MEEGSPPSKKEDRLQKQEEVVLSLNYCHTALARNIFAPFPEQLILGFQGAEIFSFTYFGIP